jgi:hypothetical protein
MDEGSQHFGKIMENKTGFDLNGAIAEWRSGMGREDALGAEALRELESHLREGVRELTGKGLSEEEAFLIARRRMGAGPELAKEFAAADPEGVWRRRLFWFVMMSVFTWLFAEFYMVLGQVFMSSDFVRTMKYGSVPWIWILAGISAFLVCRGVVRRVSAIGRAGVGLSRRKVGAGVCYGILALKAFNIFVFPLLFTVMLTLDGSNPRWQAAPGNVIAGYVIKQCLWILLAVAVGFFVTKFAPDQKAKETA